MFILRTITESPQASTHNISIGNNYSFVDRKLEGERFEAIAKDLHPISEKTKGYSESIIGFILYGGNYPDPTTKIETLRIGCHYYIMTESGKTFEKI